LLANAVGQLMMIWLSGRLREQARSHNWIGFGQLGEWLACELSSLVGQLPQAGRNWSAVGPSSRAGSLLQVDGMQSERDELAGRPPSRASSLPQGVVGLVGVG